MKRRGMQIDAEPDTFKPNRTQGEIRRIRVARHEGGQRWGGVYYGGRIVNNLNLDDTLWARWDAWQNGARGRQLLQVKAPYFGRYPLPLP